MRIGSRVYGVKSVSGFRRNTKVESSLAVLSKVFK